MSNKKFGYARVSTTDQNEDRQVLDLVNNPAQIKRFGRSL